MWSSKARGDDHGLADEAAEEREGRDRKAADQREDKRPRHLLVKPAQLGELALAGHVEHRAAAHEEQALVEDVGEGVGAGAVDGQLGAEADAGHHVADLADDVVGEQAAAVVLEHGIDDAVERHDHAQRHEDLHAGKAAAEGIDGGLGGEGAEEDRAVERWPRRRRRAARRAAAARRR